MNRLLTSTIRSSSSSGSGSGGIIKEFDIKLLNNSIRKLLGSNHPILSRISNYYFNGTGGGSKKNLRPSLVILISKATRNNSRIDVDNWMKEGALNNSMMKVAITNNTKEGAITNNCAIGSHWDSAHDQSDQSTLSVNNTTSESHFLDSGILPTQQRLAEITEMIHTASLLHDDVIDAALQRRGIDSANKEYGNKMAILAGDFLLARASLALARLRNNEVVEILSTVIANLVEGEFMQLRNSSGSYHSQFPSTYTPSSTESDPRFGYYLHKTYLKTASLIAKSCHASTLLSNCTPAIQQAAFSYGRNLGIAFQLVDDMLDFTSSSTIFGKPVNADLSLGLATAPVLYAAMKHTQLHPLISRNFDRPGDVQLATEMVRDSDGIEQTKRLAALFCAEAVKSLEVFEESEAKGDLIGWADKVLSRTK